MVVIDKKILIDKIKKAPEIDFPDISEEDIEKLGQISISDVQRAINIVSDLTKEREREEGVIEKQKEEKEKLTQDSDKIKKEIEELKKARKDEKKLTALASKKVLEKLSKATITKGYERVGDAIISSDVLRKLDICWENKMPVLLMGPNSSGKNKIITEYIKSKKSRVLDIPMTGDTTSSDFFGQYAPDGQGGFSFKDGMMTNAMRKGRCANIDEVNMAHSDILAGINNLLNVKDGKLGDLIIHNTGEIITPHEDCRIFATCNPLDYAETKDMNLATLSRFVTIRIDYLDVDTEAGLIHQKYPSVDLSIIKTICNSAKEVRELKKKKEIIFDIGTRMLEKMVLFISGGIDFEQSYQHIISSCMIDEEKKKMNKAFNVMG